MNDFLFPHGCHEKDATFTSLLEEDDIILWDQTRFPLVRCLEPAWFHRGVDYTGKERREK